MIGAQQRGFPSVLRHFIYTVLDPATPTRSSRGFRMLHHVVIIVGIAAMVLLTVPALAAGYGAALELLFDAAVAFFGVEYLARLYVAPEMPWVHGGAWRARAQWALSLAGVVDLLGVLPIVATWVLAGGAGDAQLVGLVWLLKLAPYSEGLALLGRVLRHARMQLVSVMLGFAIIFLSAGTLAYLLERETQPDTFGSIPAALWWAIVTLTTTGYGDATPVTLGGRLLAGTVMICGIAIFALWAGILASGFADEIRRREFLRTWDLVAKVPFFQHVGAATIAEVARLLRPRDAAAGAVIVRRGQPGDSMYFVVEGEVEVHLEPEPIRLGVGSFFGEIALVTGGARTATVVAKQPTRLLTLELADFRELAARRPELMQIIDAEARRRLGAGRVSALAER
jgi:voltage-gated potassium channel